MSKETHSTKVMKWALTALFAAAVAVGGASALMGGGDSPKTPTQTVAPSGNSW